MNSKKTKMPFNDNNSIKEVYKADNGNKEIDMLEVLKEVYTSTNERIPIVITSKRKIIQTSHYKYNRWCYEELKDINFYEYIIAIKHVYMKQNYDNIVIQCQKNTKIDSMEYHPFAKKYKYMIRAIMKVSILACRYRLPLPKLMSKKLSCQPAKLIILH